MEKYDLQRIVGQGSFGKAVLCRRKSDGKLCIIKQISLAKLSAKEAKLTEQEATLLSRLRHPNIVTFWESFTSKSQLHIVMEYADGGDLDHYIKNYTKTNRGKEIPERQVLNLFVQISLAIKHIHDRKILHRDLKSQNVFLTSSGLCKLGDFGVSKVLRNTVELAVTQIGTPYYMSPEIMDNQRYNSKTDIWSLGCILYELMCQRLPFGGQSMKQLCHNIAYSNPSPPSSVYSSELRELVRDTLIKNPKNRPGINSILSRPVIQSRIANFLGETKLQTEFNHTVLHGVDVLKSNPLPPSNAGVAPLVPRPTGNAMAVPRPSQGAVVAAAPLRAASPPVVNPFAALAAPAPSAPSTPSAPSAPSAAQIQQAKIDQQVAELKKLQAAAKQREEQSRKASEALIAAENERLRLKAVQAKKEAMEAENRAKEQREAEIQRRMREREAEMARIKAQQQQLEREQRQAALRAAERKKKAAEEARLAQYHRVVAKKQQQQPVALRPSAVASPALNRPSQHGLAARESNATNMQVRGNSVPTAGPPPAPSKISAVPASVAGPSSRASVPSCTPGFSSAPKAVAVPGSDASPAPKLGPVPIARVQSPAAANRNNVADEAIQKAQDVLKLLEAHKQNRLTPRSPSVVSSSSSEDLQSPAAAAAREVVSSSSSAAAPRLSPSPSSSPWFAQLADQMSDLQSQVKNLQAARSPVPPSGKGPSSASSPVAPQGASSAAMVGVAGLSPLRAAPSAVSSNRSPLIRKPEGRVSYPLQQQGAAAGGAAVVSPSPPPLTRGPSQPASSSTSSSSSAAKKRLSDPPPSLKLQQQLAVRKSAQHQVGAPTASSSVRSSQSAGIKKASVHSPPPPAPPSVEKADLEGRKADRQKHQAGFKQFLKAQRQAHLVPKPDMIFDLDNETREEGTDCNSVLEPSTAPVKMDQSTKNSMAINQEAKRGGLIPSDSASLGSSVPPAGSSDRLDQLRKQHEQQRLEMKKMIQMQKRRMLDGHNALQYGGSGVVGIAAEHESQSAASDPEPHSETYSDLVLQDFVYVATPKKAPPVAILEENEAEEESSHVREEDSLSEILAGSCEEAEEGSQPVDDSLNNPEEEEEKKEFLGQSFVAQQQSTVDLIIDDATALEYSLMLNQMQSILALPSVGRIGDAAASGLTPVNEEEDEDGFEDEVSEEEEVNIAEEVEAELVPLSENYSDDEREAPQVEDADDCPEDGPVSGISVNHSVDYAQTLFAELKAGSNDPEEEEEGSVDHISPFSEGEGEHTSRDVFNITATLPTPHIMNIVTSQNENSFFKLSNDSLNNVSNLESSYQMHEELLLRITHLRGYLTNQLGLEKFSSAMHFLTALPQEEDEQHIEAAEDDEQLLNDLEGIIGEEGLHLLDDLFQLITLESRLVD